ncbi:MAG: hypothetical protein V8S95_13705, partial [Odoribacter sp.]
MHHYEGVLLLHFVWVSELFHDIVTGIITTESGSLAYSCMGKKNKKAIHLSMTEIFCEDRENSE